MGGYEAFASHESCNRPAGVPGPHHCGFLLGTTCWSNHAMKLSQALQGIFETISSASMILCDFVASHVWGLFRGNDQNFRCGGQPKVWEVLGRWANPETGHGLRTPSESHGQRVGERKREREREKEREREGEREKERERERETEINKQIYKERESKKEKERKEKNRTAQHSTAQDRTGQHRTAQHRAEQSRTEQNRTEGRQGKARQGKAKQSKARQTDRQTDRQKDTNK